MPDGRSIFGDRHGLGATGRRTRPPISEGDRGELRACIAIDRWNNCLILDFGQSITWFAMTRDEALATADALIEKANQLEG